MYYISYSHSMVALGFGDISKHTRLTFLTSFNIRSVIFIKIGHSTGSMVAVMASTVLTARIITGHSKERALSLTPTDLKSGTMVKYCHTFLSNPAI